MWMLMRKMMKALEEYAYEETYEENDIDTEEEDDDDDQSYYDSDSDQKIFKNTYYCIVQPILFFMCTSNYKY